MSLYFALLGHILIRQVTLIESDAAVHASDNQVASAFGAPTPEGPSLHIALCATHTTDLQAPQALAYSRDPKPSLGP